MKIAPDNLNAQLARQFHPVYLVSGEEPLLVGEAADAIRARARECGFTEREVHFVDRSTNWDDIRGATGNLSLFASRKLVEIRMPTGKPGVSGAKVIGGMIDRRDADICLLIVTERLERETLSAEWVRAAEAHGVWVNAPPVSRERLPGWLRERCRRVGLDADEPALALLAARTEGNLLAADQEIAKLALLMPGAKLDVAAIAEGVVGSARFSVFEFGTALTHGDAARALRVLAGLQAEGEEAPLVLWSALQALRRFWSAIQTDGGGRGGYRGPPPPPGSRQRAERLPYARLAARALRVDRMIKGRLAGNPWDELALLAAEMCGPRVLPLPSALRS